MRVVLTGGGTDGHLIPFEPIVEELRVMHEQERRRLPAWVGRGRLRIYFLGVLDQKSRDFFKRLNVSTRHIPAAKLRRYPSGRTITDILFRMPVGLVLALWQLWWIMPDVVVSKGGYGSVPVATAAMFYRIPYLLHESDAASGLANRLMGIGASVITVGFAATRHEMRFYRSKTIATGTPVRAGLAQLTVGEAKRVFGFEPQERVLLVMGGSQGAQRINELLLGSLRSLIEEMAIIHLTGQAHLAAVQQEAAEVFGGKLPARYKPVAFLTDQMGAALVAADVVVTRAGGTSLAELARLRKAAIVIPLPGAAQDHQRHNAEAFERAEAVRVLGQENMGRALFEQNVRELMGSEEQRHVLSTNIARLDHPAAARDIARLVFKLAAGLVPLQPTVGRPPRNKGRAKKAEAKRLAKN